MASVARSGRGVAGWAEPEFNDTSDGSTPPEPCVVCSEGVVWAVGVVWSVGDKVERGRPFDLEGGVGLLALPSKGLGNNRGGEERCDGEEGRPAVPEGASADWSISEDAGEEECLVPSSPGACWCALEEVVPEL